ncbi:MAG: neutral/alkaline non-lysosomal ceramidase N-terminal domain-containing protein [Gemmataceae bacterium]
MRSGSLLGLFLLLGTLFLAYMSIPTVGENACSVFNEIKPLQAGFGEADITPAVEEGKTVYMAGFGHNRKATKVHDPLKARAVVLTHGDEKIALVAVDLVGYFLPNVEKVRARLPGFNYVLVSSTHNHEGPDSMGLWGSNPFLSGVNADYMKLIENRIVAAVQAADKAARPVSARYGSARDAALVRDNREPYVKHDELAALEFRDEDDKPAGLIVQWNCHPETLGSKNTELSADFVGYTVSYLEKQRGCPVVYFTGTVGGLLTTLGLEVKDEAGRPLEDGTFAKTERYGQQVGKLAERALANAQPVTLTPFDIKKRDVYLPLANRLYLLARQLKVVERQAYRWTGDIYQAKPAEANEVKELCLRTEIAWLKLGELEIAALPGEIYPELVLGGVQDPADPGADFSDAAIEPIVYQQLTAKKRMLIGLANDELGYIIPKRQWDEKPPYCYGRKRSQYGEINSVGPETAPILCRAFKELRGRK